MGFHNSTSNFKISILHTYTHNVYYMYCTVRVTTKYEGTNISINNYSKNNNQLVFSFLSYPVVYFIQSKIINMYEMYVCMLSHTFTYTHACNVLIMPWFFYEFVDPHRYRHPRSRHLFVFFCPFSSSSSSSLVVQVVLFLLRWVQNSCWLSETLLQQP